MGKEMKWCKCEKPCREILEVDRNICRHCNKPIKPYKKKGDLMELTKVSALIEGKIKLLEAGRKELQSRAERKAETIAAYEKRIGVIMVELKNGVEMLWEGQTVKDPPTTLIEKIARGMAWEEKLEMEKCDALYRNAIAGLACIQAELNGFQSINRFQSET